MRAVVDTNVLIYDTFEDSAFHEKARTLLEELDEWRMPSIVIHEYVWFMKGLGVSVRDVLEKVREYVLHAKSVLIVEERDDAIRSLEAISSEELPLSRFNDKLILNMAVKDRIPVATFDMKLRRQVLEKGLIVLPQAF